MTTIIMKTILAVPIIVILLSALPTMSTQIVFARHHDSGGSSGSGDNSGSSGGSSDNGNSNGGSNDNSGNSGSGSGDNSGSSSSSSSSQSTCPDGSQPDSNGNCPNNSQQQPPQQQSTKDKICSALHVKDIGILAPLLVALHLITLGASTVAILGAAAAYCG